MSFCVCLNNAPEAIEMTKEVKVEMTTSDDGLFQAVVTTVTTENGEKHTSYETFKGTEAEVKAKY